MMICTYASIGIMTELCNQSSIYDACFSGTFCVSGFFPYTTWLCSQSANKAYSSG